MLKVICIKDISMDGLGRVLLAGESYQLTGCNPLATIDEKGNKHVIGNDFQDPWFLEHFKVKK